MKSPDQPKRARRIAEGLAVGFARLCTGALQLYWAAKLRRDIAALYYQDDYLLADIGLTRDDLRDAAAQPLWRDPTVTLQQRAGATRRASLRPPAAPRDHACHELATLIDREASNLRAPGRATRHDARRQLAAVFLVGAFVACLGAGTAIAQPICKPSLAIKDVQFSAMQPPTLERKWTALVSVDASRCAENARGSFEIGFSRLKENALELDFYERFQWKTPAVRLNLDFWADEAVERYWLGNVAPCACRG